MTAIRPYVPRENSINDAALCYLSCERAVLGEMSAQVVAWAKHHLGSDWHRIVRDDPNLWGMDSWEQPEDAFYILKCLAQIPISKISHVFGHPKDIGPKAKPVFLARNRWSHFSNELVMSKITQEISQLRDFAKISGLEVATDVENAFLELVRLASTAIAAPLSPRPRAVTSGEKNVAPARPRVGEPWFDDLPAEVWEISEKLHDIKSKSDGQSMKSRWKDPDEGQFAIARLFHLNLSPKVLYVDPADGATVGFREGHPYLVGFVGRTPELADSEYQGFFEDLDLVFKENDLLLSHLGEPAFSSWARREDLIQSLIENGVSEEDEILLTDFGDVVIMTEKGAKGIFAVEPKLLLSLWGGR